MRKGLILTARDLEILAHLLFGPATVLNIFKYFFENGNANRDTRWRVMMRRLKKLEQAKLIKSAFSPRIHSLIFVLDKAGAECAADRYGVEVSSATCYVPKPSNIFHDLIVSGTAKIIVKEVERMSTCRLDYILSEAYVRKEEGRPKKGVYYPDLRSRIITPHGAVVYDIEVDCGTISKADFLGKIASFRNTIVVIVRTAARFVLLKKYLLDIDVHKPVFMATFTEISSKGFFMAEFWEKATNKSRTLL